jgi:hypothetical protein
MGAAFKLLHRCTIVLVKGGTIESIQFYPEFCTEHDTPDGGKRLFIPWRSRVSDGDEHLGA